MKKVVPIFQQTGTYISRVICREGPSPSFVCFYKNKSQILFTKKTIIKFCQLTKGTQTRTDFDAWWDEWIEGDFPEVSLDMEMVRKTGFGPEAHADEKEDPTKDTKMVT